jgi:hypothetical protein
MLSQPQREEMRYAVREQLVAAQTVALTAEMMFRRVQRARIVDFKFEVGDIEAALGLLVGLGQAKETAASLGATKFYQATAAGVLAQERNE